MSLNKLTNCNRTLNFLDIGAECINTKELKINGQEIKPHHIENNTVSLWERQNLGNDNYTWVFEDGSWKFKFDEILITANSLPRQKVYGDKLEVYNNDWAIRYLGDKKAVLSINLNLLIDNQSNGPGSAPIPNSIAETLISDMYVYTQSYIGDLTSVAHIYNVANTQNKSNWNLSRTIEVNSQDILRFRLGVSPNTIVGIQAGSTDTMRLRYFNIRIQLLEEIDL